MVKFEGQKVKLGPNLLFYHLYLKQPNMQKNKPIKVKFGSEVHIIGSLTWQIRPWLEKGGVSTGALGTW